MPVFQYKGRSGRGDLIKGTLEAEGPDAVAARLFNSGITPIEIAAARGEREDQLGQLWRQLGGGRPTTDDLILFSRQMYTISRAGLPLLRGLNGLARSTRNVVLREALEDVIASLEGGRDLAGSMARHPKVFSNLYVSLVRVGESTGRLEEAFLTLYEYLQKDRDIRDRVKTAVRYPAFVLIAMGIAVGVITTWVIPAFAPIFRSLGDQVPLPTQIIIGASDFAVNYWYVVLAAGAAAGLGFWSWVRTEKGRLRWDRMKLGFPVIGSILRRATLARITRSFSVGLNAGLPLMQTLNLTARTANNEFLAERVLNLRDGVERGETLGRTAAMVGLFTPLVLQMIAVGEETGALPELLREVSDFYEREVDYDLKYLSEALEPVLIVAIGFMVLILALGVFLPLWDMAANAGGAG